jgi:hypothetical protein
VRYLLLAVTAAFPILAAGFTRQEAEVDRLVRSLSSSDFEEQGRAAKALEQMGRPALPALRKAAQGTNPDAKYWAEKIIARIEASAKGRGLEAVIEKLGSEDDQVKEGAESEIRKAGRAALPLLKEAVRTENQNLRRRAEKLIREIENSSEVPSAADEDFAGRIRDRARLLTRAGGDKEIETSILSALAWLARHQSPDGSWGAEAFVERCGGRRCTGIGDPDHDRGVTSLAVLAFLGAGFVPPAAPEGPEGAAADTVRRFGEAARKGLAWLVSRQDRLGGVGGRGAKYMYSHAMGTLALVEAFGMTGQAPYKDAAGRALQFLVSARNPERVWRYSTGGGDNDTSVTGWCVEALYAAELANLGTPSADLRDAVIKWLDEVTDDRGRAGYNARNSPKVFVPGKNDQFGHHETMTAISVLSRDLLKRLDSKNPKVVAGLGLLSADAPAWSRDKIDSYYWHWASLALYQSDGPEGAAWKAWNGALQAALLRNQETGICVNGSWSPEEDRWGFEGGRVYATALNALTLETACRYPPPPLRK